MEKLLLVEDDADIAFAVKNFLLESGYSVHHCADGLAAKELIQKEKFDLLLLDIMLPGMNGLDLCKLLRQHNPVLPILMLTSLDSEADRILGLELGADDYLTKPFSLRECRARVRALLRRAQVQAVPQIAAEVMTHSASSDALAFGALNICLLTREVTFAGANIDLTVREFDLLYHLAQHEGQVFSRAQLLDQVWGYNHSGYEHTVNTHINRLRNKLAKLISDEKQPNYIQTVWGVGYKFVTPDGGANHAPQVSAINNNNQANGFHVEQFI